MTHANTNGRRNRRRGWLLAGWRGLTIPAPGRIRIPGVACMLPEVAVSGWPAGAQISGMGCAPGVKGLGLR